MKLSKIEVVDIITSTGVGVSVWDKSSYEEIKNAAGDEWLDVCFPGEISNREEAVNFAQRLLGGFDVRSVG